MTSEEYLSLLACLGIVIGALLTFIANNISSSLKEITSDLRILNDRMTTMVGKVNIHELRLNALEKKDN